MYNCSLLSMNRFIVIKHTSDSTPEYLKQSPFTSSSIESIDGVTIRRSSSATYYILSTTGNVCYIKRYAS